MKPGKWMKLAALGKELDAAGKHVEADEATASLMRAAQYLPNHWNTPLYNRKWPWRDVETEFEENDKKFMNSPRHMVPDTESNGEEPEGEGSIEQQLHGNSGGGITQRIHDSASPSAMGGTDNFTWENTYQQSVQQGRGYENRIPRH